MSRRKYLFEGELPGDDPKALPAAGELRSSGGGILKNNLSWPPGGPMLSGEWGMGDSCDGDE